MEIALITKSYDTHHVLYVILNTSNNKLICKVVMVDSDYNCNELYQSEFELHSSFKDIDKWAKEKVSFIKNLRDRLGKEMEISNQK